jgi:hypothetical protein
MRFLTVSLDKHAISWAERRKSKLKSQKLNYYGNITTICFRKKDGDIRYLTPLNIETNKQKNTVVSKNQESNTSIIKTVISY